MRRVTKPLAVTTAILANVLSIASVMAATTCAKQNFDSVAAPALPTAWTASAVGTSDNFATRSVGYVDTATNAVWADDRSDYSDVSLYSPQLGVVNLGTAPTITFRHSYTLWSPDQGPNYSGAYDGAVLEISINGGAFFDIVAAGGAFSTGAYNAALDPNFDNPLAQPPVSSSRSVWSGDSAGFKTVTVSVPASAFGGLVQFRWRLGTEGGGRSHDTHSGWWIDSVNYGGLGDVIFRDGFDGTCPN